MGDAIRAARLEAEGLLRVSELFCGDRLPGGEEDWCFHSSRAVQDQNPHKTSDEGWRQEYLWQGGEGCSQASQKDREGLPCRGLEKADLDQLKGEMQSSISRGLANVGMP